MKSLTIRQPWAQLVALNVKTIETRSRPTSYRGQVAIHAALRLGPEMDTMAGVLGDWSVHRGSRDGDVLLHRGLGRGTDLDAYQIIRGAVVAVAELMDCVPVTTHADLGDPECVVVHDDGTVDHVIPAVAPPPGPTNVVRLDEPDIPDGVHLIRDISAQALYGDFSPGRWAWMLANIRPLAEPYQMQGHQGLRDVPPDWENQILAAVS